MLFGDSIVLMIVIYHHLFVYIISKANAIHHWNYKDNHCVWYERNIYQDHLYYQYLYHF